MSSRKKNSWAFICFAVALLVLIFFAPSYGWRVREWLEGETTSPTSPTTEQTNEALQAELAQLQSMAAQIPQNPQNEIRAMVYVQYPFGFKNELLVNSGLNEGVATGSAVTFQGIFIGTVTQVFSDSAIVQTVFDPMFKMPVRGGDSQTVPGYDALLVGGAEPKATSIAKTAPVADGDILYTAAPGLPYGLPIGLVNATDTSADNLFQEATVKFAYDLSNVQTVLIER